MARWRLGLDCAMVFLAGIAGSIGGSGGRLSYSLAVGVTILGLLALRGGYRPTTESRGLDDARTIAVSAIFAAMMLTFVEGLVADNPAVAERALRACLFAAAFLVAGRGIGWIISARSLRMGLSGAPTLIIGAGRVGRLLGTRLLANPQTGLRPIGFVDDSPLEFESTHGLPVLGRIAEIERIVAEHRIEYAVISFSEASHDEQLELARRLLRLGVQVSVIPRLFEGMPDNTTLRRIEGLPLLTLSPSNPRGWRISLKYATDPILALLATALASPLLVAGALGTLLTLGRPVFFSQRRVGLDGREFVMFKFRTLPGSPESDGQANAAWAAAHSASGTDTGADLPVSSNGGHQRQPSQFGAMLRRTRIDELPQLLNVLRGEMSMVGPRPEMPHYAAIFRHGVRRYDDRHRVRSGITGWAQVNGLRGNTSLTDRIEWDNYYIESWSLWLDLKILLMTPLAPFREPPSS